MQVTSGGEATLSTSNDDDEGEDEEHDSSSHQSDSIGGPADRMFSVREKQNETLRRWQLVAPGFNNTN